jgi:glycosyltransferase involved in cell wall biosynthesis
MLLSILVSGVPSRLVAGPPASLASLLTQARTDVEILYLVDNKTRTVGAKRNALMQIARGTYVSYVDDDDEVSPDYVERLAQAAASGKADVIVFPIRVTLDGGQEGVVEPSVKAPEQEEFKPGGITKRRPIQIACWRRELVHKIKFPDVQWGEDHLWGDKASAKVKSEWRIDAVLYHYRFSAAGSEAK